MAELFDTDQEKQKQGSSWNIAAGALYGEDLAQETFLNGIAHDVVFEDIIKGVEGLSDSKSSANNEEKEKMLTSISQLSSKVNIDVGEVQAAISRIDGDRLLGETSDTYVQKRDELTKDIGDLRAQQADLTGLISQVQLNRATPAEVKSRLREIAHRSEAIIRSIPEKVSEVYVADNESRAEAAADVSERMVETIRDERRLQRYMYNQFLGEGFSKEAIDSVHNIYKQPEMNAFMQKFAPAMGEAATKQAMRGTLEIMRDNPSLGNVIKQAAEIPEQKRQEYRDVAKEVQSQVQQFTQQIQQSNPEEARALEEKAKEYESTRQQYSNGDYSINTGNIRTIIEKAKKGEITPQEAAKQIGEQQEDASKKTKDVYAFTMFKHEEKMTPESRDWLRQNPQDKVEAEDDKKLDEVAKEARTEREAGREPTRRHKAMMEHGYAHRIAKSAASYAAMLDTQVQMSQGLDGKYKSGAISKEVYDQNKAALDELYTAADGQGKIYAMRRAIETQKATGLITNEEYAQLPSLNPNDKSFQHFGKQFYENAKFSTPEELQAYSKNYADNTDARIQKALNASPEERVAYRKDVEAYGRAQAAFDKAEDSARAEAQKAADEARKNYIEKEYSKGIPLKEIGKDIKQDLSTGSGSTDIGEGKAPNRQQMAQLEYDRVYKEKRAEVFGREFMGAHDKATADKDEAMLKYMDPIKQSALKAAEEKKAELAPAAAVEVVEQTNDAKAQQIKKDLEAQGLNKEEVAVLVMDGSKEVQKKVDEKIQPEVGKVYDQKILAETKAQAQTGVIPNMDMKPVPEVRQDKAPTYMDPVPEPIMAQYQPNYIPSQFKNMGFNRPVVTIETGEGELIRTRTSPGIVNPLAANKADNDAAGKKNAAAIPSAADIAAAQSMMEKSVKDKVAAGKSSEEAREEATREVTAALAVTNKGVDAKAVVAAASSTPAAAKTVEEKPAEKAGEKGKEGADKTPDKQTAQAKADEVKKDNTGKKDAVKGGEEKKEVTAAATPAKPEEKKAAGIQA